MPIPTTIAETLDQLLAGQCTREQAMVWIELRVGEIELRIGEAVARAAKRDEFASLAMQTLLADKTVAREAKNAAKNPHKAVARVAFEMADAMLEART